MSKYGPFTNYISIPINWGGQNSTIVLKSAIIGIGAEDHQSFTVYLSSGQTVTGWCDHAEDLVAGIILELGWT